VRLSLGNDWHYDNTMTIVEGLKLWSSLLILAIAVVPFAIDKSRKFKLFTTFFLSISALIFLKHIIIRIYVILTTDKYDSTTWFNSMFQLEIHYLSAHLIALFCLHYLTINKSNKNVH
jgi:hypothetical protein